MKQSAACWTATNAKAATTMSMPSEKSCRMLLCSDSGVPSSSSMLRSMAAVLHGLHRYSEDLDFSLLKPDESFSLKAYGNALLREISSFGFHVEFESRRKTKASAIESAFLKTNTYRQLIVIEAAQDLLRDLHPAKNLKIRLEVDTDPPGGFETETRYVLQPIAFSVRVYCLPDLFAGKLHAILCRKWKTRVKGRDWYDLVWYAGRRSTTSNPGCVSPGITRMTNL